MDEEILEQLRTLAESPPLVAKQHESCSFCRKRDTSVIFSKATGAKICYKCVYQSKEAIGHFPSGAVYCFHCESVDGFALYYPGGLRVQWVFSGQDKHEDIIYSMKRVSQEFKPEMRPRQCKCSSCEGTIPVWVVSNNKYVQQAHSS